MFWKNYSMTVTMPTDTDIPGPRIYGLASLDAYVPQMYEAIASSVPRRHSRSISVFDMEEVAGANFVPCLRERCVQATVAEFFCVSEGRLFALPLKNRLIERNRMSARANVSD